jgi:signal transduction histidine kinase
MLVELHGGEIWVSSKGKGASLIFTLPVVSGSSKGKQSEQ